MFDEYKSIQSKMDQLERAKVELTKIQAQISSIESEIVSDAKKIGFLYGICRKELICHHYSYEFKTKDATKILVGDVIHFCSYPLYKDKSISVGWGEYFDIPFSEEYFDFIITKEPMKTLEEKDFEERRVD